RRPLPRARPGRPTRRGPATPRDDLLRPLRARSRHRPPARPPPVGRALAPNAPRAPARRSQLSEARASYRHRPPALAQSRLGEARDAIVETAKQNPTVGATRFRGRSQAAAAPPERVSDFADERGRCWDAEGSLSGRGREGRDLGAARGGGERGGDRPAVGVAE